MATASASDVRIEIDTYLDNSEIESILTRIQRDIDREDDMPADGTDDRKDLEATLAALFIATTRDRADSESSSGRTSVTYEESLIDQLRSRARRLGATDSLLGLEGSRRTASITAPDAKGWDGS